MAYDPSFTRPAIGKYSDDNAFVSIVGGSDAYLLEDEVNEMQWIQFNKKREMMKQMNTNGMIVDKIKQRNSSTPSYTIYKNSEYATNSNTFFVKNFDYIIDGLTANIYGAALANSNIDTITREGYNEIVLPEPETTSEYYYDFVYLEVYLKIIDFTNEATSVNIPTYGGVNNKTISFDMIDPRISLRTSKRVQLQWKISSTRLTTEPTVNNIGSIMTSITSSISKSNIKYDSEEEYYYSESTDASHLIGESNEKARIYAMPMFSVLRTNSALIEKVNITDFRDTSRSKNCMSITDEELNNYINRIEKLEEILNYVVISTNNDQKAYGLSMNRQTSSFVGSDSVEDGKTIDMYTGREVKVTNYAEDDKDNYVFAIVNLGNHYCGQVGEVWCYQKIDTTPSVSNTYGTYCVCNSGNSSILFNAFDFNKNNQEITCGIATSNGLNGVEITIPRTFLETNNIVSSNALDKCIIYAIPLYEEDKKPTEEIPSVGDIFYDYNDAEKITTTSDTVHFYLFNSGATGIPLQWFVLYTGNSTNLSMGNIIFDGTSKVDDAFGYHYCKKVTTNGFGSINVLLGTPRKKDYMKYYNPNDVDDGYSIERVEQMPKLGEIYIEQNDDVFMINTSGRGINGDADTQIRYLIFKNAYLLASDSVDTVTVI
jgi:hypothetical protein